MDVILKKKTSEEGGAYEGKSARDTKFVWKDLRIKICKN